MLQGAKSTSFVTRCLHARLNSRTERAKLLNIRFSPGKSEPMHLIPFSSNSKPNDKDQGIDLNDSIIRPSMSNKSLGVLLDHRLTIGLHIAARCAKTRITVSMIERTCRKKGSSGNALHH